MTDHKPVTADDIAEIFGTLTPEQLARLDDLMKQMAQTCKALLKPTTKQLPDGSYEHTFTMNREKP